MTTKRDQKFLRLLQRGTVEKADAMRELSITESGLRKLVARLRKQGYTILTVTSGRYWSYELGGEK